MVASRDSVSPVEASGSEIEVVSQKINKQPAEKITVAKVSLPTLPVLSHRCEKVPGMYGRIVVFRTLFFIA